PGSDRVFHRSWSGHYLPNRQVADHEISRRRAHATGRRIQSPGVPRLRLEKRQRPDRIAALGVFRGARPSPGVVLALVIPSQVEEYLAIKVITPERSTESLCIFECSPTNRSRF